jgi:hypothetical protein
MNYGRKFKVNDINNILIQFSPEFALYILKSWIVIDQFSVNI